MVVSLISTKISSDESKNDTIDTDAAECNSNSIEGGHWHNKSGGTPGSCDQNSFLDEGVD